MRWAALTAFLALGCAEPLEPFCVTNSMAAFCGQDARGNRYEAVCSVETDGGSSAERVAATCTRGVIDPCADGSEPRCEAIR